MKPATVLSFCILFFSSCHRYYVPDNVQQHVKDEILQYKDQQKTFVLRDSIFVYDLSNIVWQEKALVASLQRVSRFKAVHHKKRSRVNYYYTSGRADSIVVNQVHIITHYALTHGIEPQVTIPFSAIRSIEELRFDKEKTTRANVGAGLAVGLGVALGVVIVEGIREFKEITAWGDY